MWSPLSCSGGRRRRLCGGMAPSGRRSLTPQVPACLPARLPAPALAAAAARGTLRMLLLPACQVHAVTCLPCLPAGLSALPAALGPDL
jgi:hypothetical protein